MIKQLHHISAFTKNATENYDFYATVLGLRLVKNTVNQENTTMRHLFYGDYEGTPGTLLTFFEIPKLGHRVDKKSYFSTVSLAVPSHSLDYWQRRFADFNISTTLKKHELLVEDNDGFKIALVEIEEQIAPHKATKHTSIPSNKQIIRIVKVSIVADQFKETQRFLSDYLNLKQENDTFFTEQHLDQTTVLASQSKDRTRFGRGTIDHIAYGVDSNDELEGFYQQALTDHWTVEEYVDRGYFKSLYIKEPSGLRIELATLSPGFQLDESLEELGTHLALPPFLEKNRTAIEAQLEEIK
ncbi:MULTISPECIES: VOC family protein [Carnobacterium]|uniref:VOC family protein n=1 Tax=Carnobacterium TaxID=2747 RepID=UPI001071720D|nr:MULTISPECIES: VOC family protein [Carnobacterium]MDT1940429.1 VOC family protein [Carnobacterium divergens]MDT1942867.1 VOC family protein [Carnobacterium divergens]MDT1948673.1 VOC family protein [Carnobacterium divergens]MDT1951154.1 VOC family protein [Carnobacterium divergens]MDT1956212.1 VOC family protein [Carnobacterium divergens]